MPIELVKYGGEGTVKAITQLCQEIWKTKDWPKDWKHSVYLPLAKKGDLTECGSHRTIALITHCSKIILKIIQKRLEPYKERELADEQAGFRRNRDCRDQTANVRGITEKYQEYQKPILMCFIDYSKAFDCVDYALLWINLREMGVPEQMVVLIRNLLSGQQASVRTEHASVTASTLRKECVKAVYYRLTCSTCTVRWLWGKQG